MVRLLSEYKEEFIKKYPNIEGSSINHLLGYGNRLMGEWFKRSYAISLRTSTFNFRYNTWQRSGINELLHRRRNYGKKIRLRNKGKETDRYWMPTTPTTKKRFTKPILVRFYRWEEDVRYRSKDRISIPNVFDERKEELGILPNLMNELLVKDFIIDYEKSECKFIWEGAEYRLQFVQHTE